MKKVVGKSLAKRGALFTTTQSTIFFNCFIKINNVSYKHKLKSIFTITKQNYFLSSIWHRPKELEFELQIYSNVYKLQLSFPPSIAQRK
jgi:hypothetical protein